MGALFTAHHLGCKAIIALTESGSTALWMSRHDIHVPIFGLTHKHASERRMTLYRNVQPILMPRTTNATWRCRRPRTAGQARVPAGRRYLCHHLRRAHGLPGRYQHAQGVPGRLNAAAVPPATTTRRRAGSFGQCGARRAPAPRTEASCGQGATRRGGAVVTSTPTHRIHHATRPMRQLRSRR